MDVRPDDEAFLTANQVRTRVGGVSSMCLWRWQNDKRVQFPKPDLVLNGRRYWRLGTIRKWQEGALEAQSDAKTAAGNFAHSADQVVA